MQKETKPEDSIPGILESTPVIPKHKKSHVSRLLETLAVFLHSVSLTLTASWFTILWMFLPIWPILLVYIGWLVYDDAFTTSKDRQSSRLRGAAPYHWFCHYFPIRLHKTANLDPKKNYIFGYHPHGILSLGAFGGFATQGAGFSKLFPGINTSVLTLNSNFYVPVYRDYLLALNVKSVSKKSCVNILTRNPGDSVVIVIGGAQESLLSRPGQNNLVLKKRLGFVKLAFLTGSSLVPCFAFGESDIFEQVDNNPQTRIYRFQEIVKKVAGFTIPFFYGRGLLNKTFGLMPWRKPINIVVGEPIDLPKKSDPTSQELYEAQEEYIRRLEGIWNNYKDVFVPERVKELHLAA
ncbi:diacylglycerol O-acyltransferase Dga1 [Schizosaccharomyces cryophilus OY26]|uniref:Diacylglycerol O-acyltransferase n=1 Tax=Schizosaccharomyces cryophilus (strain OY26 / ATCC MYA-4695 / CBS 11777 / NBRC 106824 / NRRL Y48691) TaxID=653667 RepID=S9WZA4_SCHCR|nr:diacylglycerol O-acyltransferase Dga1 [Schizosaccharomyces cryophilus OY26]EPY50047.1 diacylglycerol O-acyltransferase Dga1 [Schizosaccharomyces cryophilus OY26]